MKRSSLIIFSLLLILIACHRQENPGEEKNRPETAGPSAGSVLTTNDLNLDFSKYKVTFIELGANACIPCRQMQPIMREIAAEYPGQVLVVFYDVWKNPAPAEYYKIQLIPTQVFIDEHGSELFRHVGFFPKEEIVKLLKGHGVK